MVSRAPYSFFLIGFLILPLFLLSSLETPLRMGAVLNYYNEPFMRNGFTLGLDGEFSLNKNHKLGVTFPEFTYFYFPDNLYSLGFYAEGGYRFVADRGFYAGISGGAGLSLSKKVVPVYNVEGELIDDTFTKQLLLIAQLSLGVDWERTSLDFPLRTYISLGWKGLYPNNLTIQNQAVLQLGGNYSFASVEWGRGE